jgi:hypothetical protein
MKIENNQENSKNKKNKAEYNSSDIERKQNERTSDSPKSNSDKKELPEKFSWRKTPIGDRVQIILVIINIGMLIAFICVGADQHTDSIEALKRADTSNTYTRESLQLSKQTSRIELSAYIQIDTVKITQMKEGKNLGFSLTYLNNGKTPAYDVYSVIGVIPGGKPNINILNKDWLKLQETPPISGYFVGSNASVTQPIITTIKIKDSTTIPAWKNGSKFLGIYGFIFYKNVFNDSCYTQFSMAYDHIRGGFNYRVKDNYIYTTNNPN